jgi:hypothetical protein
VDVLYGITGLSREVTERRQDPYWRINKVPADKDSGGRMLSDRHHAHIFWANKVDDEVLRQDNWFPVDLTNHLAALDVHLGRSGPELLGEVAVLIDTRQNMKVP